MSINSIIDDKLLIEDLHLAVTYATRAGLLSDKDILESLKKAEFAISNESKIERAEILHAINQVAKLIAPITVADLRFGRDPFSNKNQYRARVLQLLLTIIALGSLLFIGFFMHRLQIEQQVIVDIEEIQELKPQTKLTALRKLAQFDDPMRTPATLYDEYHNRIEELRQINSQMISTYTSALAASAIPLFPFSISDFFASDPMMAESNSATLTPAPAGLNTSSAPNAKEKDQEAEVPSKKNETPEKEIAKNPETETICSADKHGNMILPYMAHTYPAWMKTLLIDAVSDFCFQLNILSPSGDGALLNQSLNQLAFLPHIKEKVMLRTTWFLPFLYGILGAAIFLMRNVTNIRSPVMEWLPLIVRVFLGGVAGIVIGWFSSVATPGMQTTNTLSIPFALAFLTGYGIESLFTILDRFSAVIGSEKK